MYNFGPNQSLTHPLFANAIEAKSSRFFSISENKIIALLKVLLIKYCFLQNPRKISNKNLFGNHRQSEINYFIFMFPFMYAVEIYLSKLSNAFSFSPLFHQCVYVIRIVFPPK